MRKVLGWIVIIGITYKFFNQFDDIQLFIASFGFSEDANDWIIVGEILVYFWFCLYVYTRYIKTTICTHCNQVVSTLKANRGIVKITSWSYRYPNKDGTPDMRRKNNPITHVWEEMYRCANCENLTVVEKSGSIPRNVLLQAKEDITVDLAKNTQFEKDGIVNTKQGTENSNDLSNVGDSLSSIQTFTDKTFGSEEFRETYKVEYNKWRRIMEAEGVLFKKSGIVNRNQITKIMSQPRLKALYDQKPLNWIELKIKAELETESKDDSKQLFDIYIDDFNGCKGQIIDYLKEQNPKAPKKVIKSWLAEVPFNDSGGGYYEQYAIDYVEVFKKLGATAHYTLRNTK